MHTNIFHKARIVTIFFLILIVCSCQSETKTQTQTQTGNSSVVDKNENESPQGSEIALSDLSDINGLRDAFLKDSGNVRLVALMSPT